MSNSPRPSPAAMKLILLAAVSAVVMVAAVLLWVADVIPLGAMIAVLAVVGVAELVVIQSLQRSMRRQRARSERLSTEGGASTIDADSPNVRYGYDPMDDIGGDGRR